MGRSRRSCPVLSSCCLWWWWWWCWTPSSIAIFFFFFFFIDPFCPINQPLSFVCFCLLNSVVVVVVFLLLSREHSHLKKKKKEILLCFCCCCFVSSWVSVCVLLLSCLFEDHSHLKTMMILLVAVVVWVESLLFVLLCVRLFFRFRKGDFVLCMCVSVSVSVSVSCLWYPKRKEDEEEDSSLGRFLLFFCFFFPRALIALGDRPLWKPQKNNISFYVSSASLCFVLDLMRLSEVLGFRCFLLVFSVSSVLFFLWRRWTSPLLSLIVSQRVIWKIKAIFFSGKICRQFHRLCLPCLFPFPPPATTHLRRRASSVLRGQILRWSGSAIADCSRLLHAAHSHPLYTTTSAAIICRRRSSKR